MLQSIAGVRRRHEGEPAYKRVQDRLVLPRPSTRLESDHSRQRSTTPTTSGATASTSSRTASSTTGSIAYLRERPLPTPSTSSTSESTCESKKRKTPKMNRPTSARPGCIYLVLGNDYIKSQLNFRNVHVSPHNRGKQGLPHEPRKVCSDSGKSRAPYGPICEPRGVRSDIGKSHVMREGKVRKQRNDKGKPQPGRKTRCDKGKPRWWGKDRKPHGSMAK